MARIYYDPENGPDGAHPTGCQSPLGHRGRLNDYARVVVDGVPHCALDAFSDFGIRVWSTTWTPAGDSRPGISQPSTALPDDIAEWDGPSAVTSLKRNDFTNNVTYDVLLSVQTPTDGRLWLAFRAAPNEMRGAQGRALLLAQLSEGATLLTREAISTAVVYWREA